MGGWGAAGASLVLAATTGCVAPTIGVALDPLAYRFAEGIGWPPEAEVPADLQARYPAYFSIVLDRSRSEELNLLLLRDDLERLPVGRANYDALNAIAVGYFIAVSRQEEARYDETAEMAFLGLGLRSAKLLAVAVARLRRNRRRPLARRDHRLLRGRRLGIEARLPAFDWPPAENHRVTGAQGVRRDPSSPNREAQRGSRASGDLRPRGRGRSTRIARRCRRVFSAGCRVQGPFDCLAGGRAVEGRDYLRPISDRPPTTASATASAPKPIIGSAGSAEPWKAPRHNCWLFDRPPLLVRKI